MFVLVIAENVIGVDMEELLSSFKLQIFYFSFLRTHWLNN